MPQSGSSEAITRSVLVDQELARAEWANERRNQFADYVLLGNDGKSLAVVEAKRSSRDAIVGKRQASDYADIIERQFGFDPFIFLTNGKEIWFWTVAVTLNVRLPASTRETTLNDLSISQNFQSGRAHYQPRARLLATTHSFICPFCGEEISMVLDLSVHRHSYVEDCEVCCNPLEIYYTIEDDALAEFEAKCLE